jgi:hypothetical protein
MPLASILAASAACQGHDVAALPAGDAGLGGGADAAEDVRPTMVLRDAPALLGMDCPVIRASDYDQSCTSNAECVGVGEGDTCGPPCAITCPTTAINVSELTHYHSDLTAARWLYDGTCNCPAAYGTCCQDGRCTVDPCCLNPCSADY